MPLSVAQLKAVVAGRLRALLDVAGLDAAGGLDDALFVAAAMSGLDVADPMAIADDEVSGLSGTTLLKFLDLAELRTLETIWGNWAEVDVNIGGDSQSFDQLAKRLQQRIAVLLVKVAGPYAAATPATPGGMAVGRIASGRCVPGDPMATAPCTPSGTEWPGWGGLP